MPDVMGRPGIRPANGSGSQVPAIVAASVEYPLPMLERGDLVLEFPNPAFFLCQALFEVRQRLLLSLFHHTQSHHDLESTARPAIDTTRRWHLAHLEIVVQLP